MQSMESIKKCLSWFIFISSNDVPPDHTPPPLLSSPSRSNSSSDCDIRLTPHVAPTDTPPPVDSAISAVQAPSQSNRSTDFSREPMAQTLHDIHAPTLSKSARISPRPYSPITAYMPNTGYETPSSAHTNANNLKNVYP